jgi:hypothetical protein
MPWDGKAFDGLALAIIRTKREQQGRITDYREIRRLQNRSATINFVL